MGRERQLTYRRKGLAALAEASMAPVRVGDDFQGVPAVLVLNNPVDTLCRAADRRSMATGDTPPRFG
jgi:hypothetical protein